MHRAILFEFVDLKIGRLQTTAIALLRSIHQFRCFEFPPKRLRPTRSVCNEMKVYVSMKGSLRGSIKTNRHSKNMLCMGLRINKDLVYDCLLENKLHSLIEGFQINIAQ